MRTELETWYGFKFIVTDIKPEMNGPMAGYNDSVLYIQHENCSLYILDETGDPIDNEDDLNEIYNMLKGCWVVLNERCQIVFSADKAEECDKYIEDNEPANELWAVECDFNL